MHILLERSLSGNNRHACNGRAVPVVMGCAYGKVNNPTLGMLCSQRGNAAFPAWENQTLPIGWYTCHWDALNTSFGLQKNNVFQKSHHPSRQLSGTPLYKGILGFSSLPWSLSSYLPYPSRHPSLAPTSCVKHLMDQTGEMTGEIWEGSKTSLPCSNPFIQRHFRRWWERWEIFDSWWQVPWVLEQTCIQS